MVVSLYFVGGGGLGKLYRFGTRTQLMHVPCVSSVIS